MITINVKCTALLLLIVLLGLVSKTTSQAPATAPTNSNSNVCQLMPAADLTTRAFSILQVRGVPAVPAVPPPCANAFTGTAAVSRIIGPRKTCVCFLQMLASIASTLSTSPSLLASSLSSLASQILQPQPMNLGFSLDSIASCP